VQIQTKRSFEEDKKQSQGNSNSQLSARSQGSFLNNLYNGVKNKLFHGQLKPDENSLADPAVRNRAMSGRPHVGTSLKSSEGDQNL
jgi:hypothetical protein